MKKFLFILFNFLLISGIYCTSLSRCSKDDKPSLLETTSGTLSGSCEFVQINDNDSNEDRSTNVYSWLSVPYAEPPVGRLRFKAPVEVKTKSEIIDATKWPNSCMQLDKYESQTNSGQNVFEGFSMWYIDSNHSQTSEDCLYLNIFVPVDAYIKTPINSHRKHAILVYFHGGGSVTGSTVLDIYNPSTFVAATDTIVITVNYRLGLFGFFYLENEFPGNQALLDQNEALRWIRNNAEKFGGDPNRVTIIGQSAGSALGGLHLFYKDSWPYFRNMLLQSGSPIADALTPISTNEANQRSREILSLVGCTDGDIAQCAQDSAHLNKAALDYFRNAVSNNHFAEMNVITPFVPVLDGKVLTDTPLELLKKGDFKKCPVMTGFTTDEGNIFLAYAGLVGETLEEIRKQKNLNHSTFANFVKNHFAFYPNYPNKANELVFKAIIHEYTRILEETNEDEIFSPLVRPSYFQALGKVIGDSLFKCPAYRLSDLLAKHSSDVYLYLFAHRLSSTPWPSWYGATHGDDLAFTFAHPISSRKEDSIVGVNPWANPKHRYSNGEKVLTKEMIDYYSNFAKFNTPNGREVKKHWPKYTLLNLDDKTANMSDPSEAGRYMIFKTNGTRVNRGYSVEICQFWNYYLPNVIRHQGKFRII